MKLRREKGWDHYGLDMDEVRPTPDINLPGIRSTRCLTPRSRTAPYLVFECEAAERFQGPCPCCGSPYLNRYGRASEPRLIHDVNVGIKRVDLILTVMRYQCTECGAVFRETIPGIPDRCQHTERLGEQIRREAFIRPFSEVAFAFGYSEATIRNIFDEYAAELARERGPIIAPKVPGIDEKHIARKMRGIFVDIEHGTLLEMTPDNKEADIIGTIEKMIDYDKNIKVVTMDMSNGYRAYVQMCLPDAKIIVDKYHVYQDLNRQVSVVRKTILDHLRRQVAEIQDAKEKEWKEKLLTAISRDTYLFRFSRTSVSISERRVRLMADISRFFPELNHLRLIKDTFERIYDEAKTRDEAETLFREWAVLMPPTGAKKAALWEETYKVKAKLYDGLRPFYNTFSKNWHKEIFNYFDGDCRYTNAAAEGLNSAIQRINAQGTGYGFNRLRAKALYSPIVRRTHNYHIERYAELPDDVAFNYSLDYVCVNLFGFAEINGKHVRVTTWSVVEREEGKDAAPDLTDLNTIWRPQGSERHTDFYDFSESGYSSNEEPTLDSPYYDDELESLINNQRETL